ncbi:hypothetical protein PV325_006768 [Microctonus aethiopoides]|nr:hypothetical protein PV325_006768 [Microctonus aethiopoides]
MVFIMADDLNARHRPWGDSTDNYKGCSLVSWIEKFGMINKVEHYPPAQATFPRANSYLDHCLIDQFLTLDDAHDNKIRTTAYDSDHRAPIFKVNISNITKVLASAQEDPPRLMYHKPIVSVLEIGDDDAGNDDGESVVQIMKKVDFSEG